MLLDTLPRPAVFAHRGDSAHAPENTLAAFSLAIQNGADAIELDTRLSANGVPVVIHDGSVDRTTGEHGQVRRMPLSDLRRLDAGGWFHPRFRGEKIPSLEEVFAGFGERIILNVELANYESLADSLPDQVAALARRYDLAGRLLFSSFNPLALVRIRQLLPGVSTALIAFGGLPGWLARSMLLELLGCAALHPVIGDVTPALVQGLHRRGKRVNPHTANRLEAMQHMVDLQVDGFFTDDPALARQVLSGNISS